MATVFKFQTVNQEPDIVSAMKALVPELRASQAESDALGRPPEHIVEKLRAAGAYKLTIPKHYGGIGADMKTWMDAVVEIGRGNAGVAWAMNLVASANWTLANLFPKHVADEVFSVPGATVAGVFSGRKLTSRPVEGGIFVDEGTWFFNSGVYQATWDILGVTMFNAAGEPTGPGLALVPMSDVKLLHDWNTSGIRGSGSTNVSMKNVFIPSERIISLVDCVMGTRARTFEGPAPRVAFMPAMVHLLAYPILGASLHMIEHFLETLPKRDIKLTSYTKSAEAPATHLQIGEASAKIEAARLLLENGAREMDDWSQGTEYMPLLLRAKVQRDTALAEQLMWEGVDILGTASGGSFSWLSSLSNRLWQGVKVGSMHPGVSRASNYENYGRILAGVEGPPLMIV